LPEPGQAAREVLRGPQRGLHPVDVLDPGEHRKPLGRLPEPVAAHRRQVALLVSEPALPVDDRAQPLELVHEERRLLRTSAGAEREAVEAELLGGRLLVPIGLVGVRIDERDVEAVAARADEQELVALGEAAGDDGRVARRTS
jgi:hypothetical protein